MYDSKTGLGVVRSFHPPLSGVRVCMSKGYTCTSEKMVLFLQQFIDCHNEYTDAVKSNSNSSDNISDSNSSTSSGEYNMSSDRGSNEGGDEGEEKDRVDIHIKG